MPRWLQSIRDLWCICSLPGTPYGSSRIVKLLCALVERQRNHARTHLTSADVDIEFAAHGGEYGGHVAHADRLLQVRRLGAARHHADGCATRCDRVALARDPLVEHLEPDQLLADAVCLLTPQHVSADEIGL